MLLDFFLFFAGLVLFALGLVNGSTAPVLFVMTAGLGVALLYRRLGRKGLTAGIGGVAAIAAAWILFARLSNPWTEVALSSFELGSGWHAAGNEISNDGSNDGSLHDSWIFSPIAIPSGNFSVEAEIEVLAEFDSCHALRGFGILFRASPSQAGYGAGFPSTSCSKSYVLFDSGIEEFPSGLTFHPSPAEWHSYRIDAAGPVLRLWLDGREVGHFDSATRHEGTLVGLFDDGVPLLVRAFRTISR